MRSGKSFPSGIVAEDLEESMVKAFHLHICGKKGISQIPHLSNQLFLLIYTTIIYNKELIETPGCSLWHSRCIDPY